MAPELRQPMAPHLRDYFTVISTGFGGSLNDDEAYQAAEGAVFEPDRTLAAYDDDRIVGGTSAYSFELTVPGGTVVPAAGVTGVAVLPTHRRQGILTELMGAQLDEIAGHGDAVAVLNASESQIYGQYGFGSADRATRVEIDTRHAGFEWPPDPGGSMELIPAADAIPHVGQVYDAARLVRPGTIARSPAWWAIVLHETASWKGGGNPFVVVHRDDAGEPDGYAVYHVRSGEMVDGHFSGTVECRELVGVHWEVEAALWRYLCGIDLTDTVVAWPRPIDDPVQWRLKEPRRLLIRGVFDMLWVRIVDVVAALEGRRYTSEGTLTLDIRDQVRSATSGVYRLEGGPDGASCVRLADDSADADLVMNVAELGTAYLGGVDITTLSNAGRVDEQTPDALLRADAMFSSRPAPFSSTFF